MKYDNVDIGTSDFDVADNLFSSTKKYLLVEPLEEYLNKIPSGKNIWKENSACSDKDGTIQIFYIPEEEINKNNLPYWVKGCNKIAEPHKILVDYLNNFNIDLSIIKSKIINMISFNNLIIKYNIEHINNLKIDTEGHDHIIFKEVSKSILQGKISCDMIILEYIIGRYGNNTEYIDRAAYSLRHIFPNVKFESENLIFSR